MPLYTFVCPNGHRMEYIEPMGTEHVLCAEEECGRVADRDMTPARVAFRTGGVGNTRSSGEPLSRGERYLATLHYGKCIPDKLAPGGMRAPQTEGELSRVLAEHGKRRGTASEFNEERVAEHQARADADAEADRAAARVFSEDEVMSHTASESTVRRVRARREFVRSAYDHGAIPKKEVPADVKPLMPK